MAAKWILLGSIGSAFILAFILMILLRFLAGPIVISSIIILIAGSAYIGYLLFSYG
jgi:hypothetical protein